MTKIQMQTVIISEYLSTDPEVTEDFVVLLNYVNTGLDGIYNCQDDLLYGMNDSQLSYVGNCISLRTAAI